MTVSLRRIAVLALAGLVGLGVGEAFAQRPLPNPQLPPLGAIRPRPFNLSPFASRPVIQPFSPYAFTPSGIAAQQFAFNASQVGRGLSNIPPYALGFNPYTPPVLSTGPVVAPAVPFSLATNPYATTAAASLSSSPYGGYSMSTTPYGSSGSPYSNSGYGYQDPYGSYLQGVASVTAATGQYYKQIQEASLTREYRRQMAIDTARKQLEFEMWRDSVRPTSPKLIRAEKAVDLDEARNYASATKIWSGDALNELLRSVIKSGKLNRGPGISLDESTLKNLNLTDRSSRGNVGLLKDGGKLNWPLVLHEAPFDETRAELGVKLRNAVDQLKELKKVEPRTLKDAEALHKTLTDKVNDSADDLTPAQHIEAKRYLNQVGQAIRALQSPNARKYFDNTWNAKGKTVAELVAHMRDEGLEFAPATSGDEAAYRALYNALRNFEAGTQRSQGTVKE